MTDVHGNALGRVEGLVVGHSDEAASGLAILGPRDGRREGGVRSAEWR